MMLNPGGAPVALGAFPCPHWNITRRAWGPGTGEITFLAVSFVLHKHNIEDEMKGVVNC